MRILILGAIATRDHSSVRLLPGWAQAATHATPIFYMVNAFRYDLLDSSDVPVWEPTR
jgi:ABC-2 type transport system permease protein